MKKYLILPAMSLLFLASCAKSDLRNNGCTDPAYSWADADGSTHYSIPNVFTPEGNGLNDVFFVAYNGEWTSYSMEITKGTSTVFSSTNVNDQWDGTKNGGSDAREGVYDYHITGSIDGYPVDKKGQITLIRSENVRIEACELCVPPQTTSEPYCIVP